MKKLTHFATALANNTLSTSDMTHVRGGIDPVTNSTPVPETPDPNPSMTEDEKRRARPGGGISTN